MKFEFEIEIVESAAQAEALSNFLSTIWQGEDDVTPFDLILAAVHVGGYAALAKHEGNTVGASFGFLGSYAGQTVLHSHVTGANVAGAGFALKQHQFAWAKDLGLDAITWTFDPLVRRNCVFNFEKLGALGLEYLPNFYGTMTDDINAGDDSDRLFAYWPLDDSIQLDTETSEQFALRNVDGQPVASNHDAASAYWVELPADIETLRKDDIELARRWRQEVRRVLHEPLEKGWFIRSVNNDRTAILVEPATSDYELGEEE